MLHRPSTTADPPRGRGGILRRWAPACALVGSAAAAMYLGLYHVRGFRLPVGFDASWYAWRGSFVSGHGLGPLGTSARPGSEVVAALLGSVTRRSQLELAVLLPPALAGAFGLALGSVVWSAVGPSPGRWLTAAAGGGALLGATRLVDENVATLLFLVVLVAAVVALGGLGVARQARAAARRVERPTVPRTVVLGWLLVAWTVVCVVGLAYGAVTEALPPHRFLELLVVVPGLVAIAHVVGWVATSVADRTGAAAGGLVAVLAAAAVALPGAAAWYGTGSPKPWIEPAALQQAGV